MKTINVNYGKFSSDICVQDDLYNAIYEKGKADTIKQLEENIHEIYKCQFYCMADMCEHDSPTVDMCIDCFYDSVQKSLERLKEKK